MSGIAEPASHLSLQRMRRRSSLGHSERSTGRGECARRRLGLAEARNETRRKCFRGIGWAPGECSCRCLALVAAVYAPVSSAWFCGYDDFHELARAAFEFGPEPTRIVTRSNGDGLRYRPLHPAMTVATWSVAGMNAWVYRARNIALHLVNVALLYALGILLLGATRPGRERRGALWHSSTREPGRSTARSGPTRWPTRSRSAGTVLTLHGLGAVAFRGAPTASVLGAACGLLGVLVYEPTAALAGPALARARARLPACVPAPFGGSSARNSRCVACAGLLRLGRAPAMATRPRSRSMPTAAVYVRNLALSFGAMLLPIDPVLAAEFWGTPLPSEDRRRATG